MSKSKPNSKINPNVFSTKTQVIEILESLINKGSASYDLHEKRLDNFEIIQHNVGSKVDLLISQNTIIFEKIDELHKILWKGNGDPGVMTRIEIIESKHKDHINQQKEFKQDHKFNRSNLITILLAFLMMLITIWSVYKSEQKVESEIRHQLKTLSIKSP